MKPTANSYLLEIENYKPGKAKIGSQKAIKLSSNENALGASPKAISAYVNHAKDLALYADGACSELRQALANKYKIDADKIVCGAGSDEILALITQGFAGCGDEIIYSEYGFLMYPISAKRVGAKAIKAKETNLRTDVKAILAAITPKTKLIFIANPNNPTGSYINKSEMQELIDNTPKNVIIVLDHAYEEFVEESDYPNAIELVNQHENVIMTRTFSKIYGLASLRIGWSYSSSYIAEILNKVRGPFNVSGPAQFAAVAAIEDEEFFAKSQEHNRKWLKIYQENLAKFSHLKAYPSITNFILVDFHSLENCQKANEAFLKEGIILREMSAYSLPTCLRISIGSDQDNEKVLSILTNLKNG